MTIGGLLQLAGVAVIFWEISGIQRTLRLPPWWRSAISDLRRLLSSVPGRFRGRRNHQVELRGTVTSRGTLDVTVIRATPAEGTTVDERLDNYRRQLAALREELDQVRQRLDRDREEQGAAVTALETRLGSEIASVRKLLSDLSGGFLRGRALGGGLILLGTALITIGVWL
jgi:hypothetical protein